VQKGAVATNLIPLTVPAVRRLVLAMEEPPPRHRFRLRWSDWRRRHQAGAQRCHAARRARRQAVGRRVTVPLALAAPPGPVLTDHEWALVRPLLPPQQPDRGRRRHDHRRVLSGILWVLRTKSSWRAMPERYGKWDTAYQRYRLWRRTGLWQSILERLNEQPGDDPPPDAHREEVSL
jgi:transposase